MSRAPSSASGSQRKPTTVPPSSSSTSPSAIGCGIAARKVPSAAGESAQTLARQRGAALGDPDDSRLRRLGVERVEAVASARSRAAPSEPRPAFGQLMVQRLAREVRPGDEQLDRRPRRSAGTDRDAGSPVEQRRATSAATASWKAGASTWTPNWPPSASPAGTATAQRSSRLRVGVGGRASRSRRSGRLRPRRSSAGRWWSGGACVELGEERPRLEREPVEALAVGEVLGGGGASPRRRRSRRTAGSTSSRWASTNAPTAAWRSATNAPP